MFYVILLAAGQSARMGQPKQLLDWHGRPLVRHMAEVALSSRLDGAVVVLGAYAPAVRAALDGLSGPLELVACADYAAGQAASLRCGLATLPSEAGAALVLLVDQPLVTPALIDQLCAAFVADPTALAVVPRYQGRRGNPVLLSAGLFAELRTLEGDHGARDLLQRHAARVRWLDLDDPAVVTDLDTPADYRRLRGI
jgi:molybdenum cofactor cytidylyltransferase